MHIEPLRRAIQSEVDSMSDGSIVIDTKIDDSGLSGGLSKLTGAVGAGLAAIGTGMVAVGKEAVNMGMQFESGMANIQAITGMTKAEIDVFGEGLLEIARDTGVSFQELVTNSKMVAEAGGDMDRMMEQIRHGTNLAVASQSDLATSLDFVGSAMKTFGMETSQTEQVVDSFAMLTTMANLELSQMAQSYVSLGSKAVDAGLSIHDVNAVLYTFAERGLKGADAGHSLGAVLRQLSTPSNIAREAFDELGVALYDVNGKSRDTWDVLKDLELAYNGQTKATKNMTEEERNLLFMQALLKDGLEGFKKMADEGIDSLQEISAELENAGEATGGLAAHMADIQTDTLQGALNKLGQSAASLGIMVSKELNPALKEGALQLKSFLDEATKAFKAGGFEALFDSLGGILGKAITMILGYTSQIAQAAKQIMTSMAKAIKQNMPQISKAFGEIGGVLLQTVAEILPDIVEIGTELILGLIDGITNTLPQLIPAGVQALVSIATGLVQAIPRLVEKIPQIVDALIQGFKNTDWAGLWDQLVTSFTQTWDALKSAAEVVWEWLKESFNSVVDWIKSVDWSEVWETLKTTAKDAWEAVKEAAKAVWDWIKEAAISVWEAIKAIDWASIWETLKSAASAAWEWIKGVFSNLGNDIRASLNLPETASWGEIGTALWNGAKEKLGKLGSDIKEWITGDPSATWSDVGTLILDGIKTGLGAIGGVIKGLITGDSTASWSDVGKAILEGIKTGLGALGGVIKGLITGDSSASWSEVGTAILEGIKAGLGAIGGVIKGLITGDSTASWSEVGTAILEGIKTGLGALGGVIKGLITGDSSATWSEVGTSILEGIKTGLGALGGVIKGLITGDSTASWSEVGTAILEGIKTGLASLGSVIKGLITGDTGASWSEVGTAILEGIKTGLGALGSVIKGLITGDSSASWSEVGTAILEGIKTGLGALGGVIKGLITGDPTASWGDVGTAIYNGIKEKLSSVSWSDIFSGLSDIATSIAGMFDGAKLSMTEIETIANRFNTPATSQMNMFSGMVTDTSAIKKNIADAESSINSIVQKGLEQTFKLSLGIEVDPIDTSKLTADVETLIQGGLELIGEQAYNAKIAVDATIRDAGLKESLMGSINSTFSAMGADVEAAGEQLKSYITKAFEGPITAEEANKIATYIKQYNDAIAQATRDQEFRAEISRIMIESDVDAVDKASVRKLADNVREASQKGLENLEQFRLDQEFVVLSDKNLTIDEKRSLVEGINREIRDRATEISLEPFVNVFNELNEQVAFDGVEETVENISRIMTQQLPDVLKNADLQTMEALGSSSEIFKNFFPTLANEFSAGTQQATPQMLADAKAALGEFASMARSDMNVGELALLIQEYGEYGQELPASIADGISAGIIDPKVREAAKGMYEGLKPDIDAMRSLAEEYKKDGQQIPQALADALTAADALQILSGSTEEMWTAIDEATRRRMAETGQNFGDAMADVLGELSGAISTDLQLGDALAMAVEVMFGSGIDALGGKKEEFISKLRELGVEATDLIGVQMPQDIADRLREGSITVEQAAIEMAELLGITLEEGAATITEDGALPGAIDETLNQATAVVEGETVSASLADAMTRMQEAIDAGDLAGAMSIAISEMFQGGLTELDTWQAELNSKLSSMGVEAGSLLGVTLPAGIAEGLRTGQIQVDEASAAILAAAAGDEAKIAELMTKMKTTGDDAGGEQATGLEETAEEQTTAVGVIVDAATAAVGETLPVTMHDKGVEGGQALATGVAEQEPVVTESIENLKQNGVITPLEPLPEDMRQVAADGIQAMTDAVIAGSPLLIQDTTDAAQGSVDAAKAIMNTESGTEIGKSFSDGEISAINAGAGPMQSAAQQAAQGAVNAAQGVLTHAAGYNIASQFAQGIVDGLNSKLGEIQSAAASIASAVAEAAAAALQIKSPSRIGIWIGEMFGLGVAEGVENSKSMVESASEDVASAAAESITDEFENAAIREMAFSVDAEINFDPDDLIAKAQAAFDAHVFEINVNATGSIGGNVSNGHGTVVIENINITTERIDTEIDFQEAMEQAMRNTANESTRISRYKGGNVRGG